MSTTHRLEHYAKAVLFWLFRQIDGLLLWIGRLEYNTLAWITKDVHQFFTDLLALGTTIFVVFGTMAAIRSARASEEQAIAAKAQAIAADRQAVAADAQVVSANAQADAGRQQTLIATLQLKEQLRPVLKLERFDETQGWTWPMHRFRVRNVGSGPATGLLVRIRNASDDQSKPHVYYTGLRAVTLAPNQATWLPLKRKERWRELGLTYRSQQQEWFLTLCTLVDDGDLIENYGEGLPEPIVDGEVEL